MYKTSRESLKKLKFSIKPRPQITIKVEEENISKIFTPRSCWVQDNDTNNCFNCDKQFSTILLTRRHHCRMCGHIFCSKCSNNFLQPPKYRFENEKQIRVCDHCNTFIQSLDYNEDPEETPSHKTSNRYRNRRVSTIFHPGGASIQEQIREKLNESLTAVLYKIVENISSHLFKQFNIYDNWYMLLKDFIIACLEDIHLNSLENHDTQLEDPINVNHYIKIKKIPYEDNSLTRLIRGLVIRKNVANKKMSYNLLNPRVIAIENSLEYNDVDLTTIDSRYIAKEREFVKNFENLISSLNPDIIFVEKSVSLMIQEAIKSKGITLIYKLRKTQFQKILRFLNLKALTYSSMQTEVPNQNDLDYYVRELSNFTIINHDNLNFYKDKLNNNQDIKTYDPTLLYLEMYLNMEKQDLMEISKGMTITISGPSYKEMKLVKECLKRVFKILYNIFLEKELIIQDLLLYNSRDAILNLYTIYRKDNLIKINKSITNDNDDDSNNSNADLDWRAILDINARSYHENIKLNNNLVLNKISSATAGFFKMYTAEKYHNLDVFIYKDTFAFTKINLISLNFSEYPDLNSLNQQETKEIEDSIRPNQKCKTDYLAQLCDEPEMHEIALYGKEDVSLGTYIIQKANGIEIKCLKCKRPRYYHTAFFYQKKAYVKIITEVVGHNKSEIYKDFTRKSHQALPNNSNTKKLKESSDFKSFGGLSDLVNSIFGKEESSVEQSNDLASHKLKDSINKTLTKSYANASHIIIYSYIECTKCKQRLTDFIELSRRYLDVSFHKYLESILEYGDENFPLIHEQKKKESQENGGNSESKRASLIQEMNGTASISKIDQSKKSEDQKTTSISSLTSISDKLASSIKDIKNGQDEKMLRCCGDSPKGRVFRYDKLLIRIIAGHSQYYTVELFDIFSDKSKNIIKSAGEVMIKEKYDLLKSKIFDLLTFCINSMQRSLTILIDKSKVDVDIENLNNLTSILHSNNPLTKEPSNKLLLDLIPVFNDLCRLESKMKNLLESYDKFTHFLEVEFIRIKFYQEYKEIIDRFDEAKEAYTQNLHQLALEEKRSPGSNNPSILGEISLKLKSESMELPDVPGLAEKRASFISSNQGSFIIEGFSVPEKSASKPSLLSSAESSIIKPFPNKGEEENEKNILKALVDGYTAPVEKEMQASPFFKFLPIYEKEPLTTIAYALNCSQYYKEIYEAEGFNKFLEKYLLSKVNMNDTGYKSFLKEKILLKEEKDKPQSIVWTYKINSTDIKLKYFHSIRNSLPIHDKDVQKKAQTMELISNIAGFINFGPTSSIIKNINSNIDKITTPKYQINIYYPIQFEALRTCNGITLQQFINSISGSYKWLDNSGGKTNAVFIKSHDNVFVFKQLDKSDFRLFSQFIYDYFDYLWKIHENNQPSLLAKIYGLFEVQIDNGSKKYYIAMENIFFGIDTSAKIRIYDLKGSELNRYVKYDKNNNNSKKVLLDTNLKVDQNSEPIPVPIQMKKWINRAFENDTTFLGSQNIIDYSLLVIINEDDNILRMGIIDYAILYTWERQVEHVGKKFIKGSTPTITHPNEYKERFTNAMNKYFMGVSV